ncbi:hypothetical protein, partial [Agrobacterium sp.]|uniref:hypothetical protein n=1 Tax=Agrobacterium sp. TaxID=361 RepID=UPI0025C72E39
SQPREVFRRSRAGERISRFGMDVSAWDALKKRRKKLQKNCFFLGKMFERALSVSMCGHCRPGN